MKIAIYSRKSKTSDKGESIENQIASCKDYIIKWSSVDTSDIEFITYKDEGFSGGNMDRPQFKKLMADAKKNKFQMLICYRLDRVSRDVADFSNTYELLQEHHIEFVSVKEQFDTSTPIGRAMLNIAMVFAQLERETIAERIRDNMLGLARTGRWLGGTTPVGFMSEPIEYIDTNMMSKKMYKLTPESAEIEKVQVIFNKFLELKSLRGTESFLLMNHIETRNNCKYTAATIKDILINPVYAAADEHMYDYLSSLGCQMCNTKEDFDGTKGLMVYNRTDQSKNKCIFREYSDWIVAIGQHEPLLTGELWIRIQKLLDENTSKSFYIKETMQYGLLTGLIKCTCGSTMKIKKGKINSEGKLAYTYVCTTKEMSRRTQCNVKNLIGQDVDQDVLDYLVSLSDDESFMMSTLNSKQIAVTKQLNLVQDKAKAFTLKLEENEKAIENLMSQLSRIPASNESLIDRYMNQLKELDEESKSLKAELVTLQDEHTATSTISVNLDVVRKALKDLNALKHEDDLHLKRALIRSVVDKIIWDGENLKIELFGQEELRNQLTSPLEKVGVSPTHFCGDSKCHSNS